MVTGDNELTAINVAKKCSIVESKVYICKVVGGTYDKLQALEFVPLESVDEIEDDRFDTGSMVLSQHRIRILNQGAPVVDECSQLRAYSGAAASSGIGDQWHRFRVLDEDSPDVRRVSRFGTKAIRD
jgi:magnesium-transporting ATPase (P-type)